LKCRERSNPSFSHRCNRCGASRNTTSRYNDGRVDSSLRIRKRTRNQRSQSSPGGEDGGRVVLSPAREFARRRQRSFSSPVHHTSTIQEEREWPPRFEEHGSYYVFDTRSNMFYEARSNFFFDSKSQLYYGNRQKAYYRYCEGQTPPYEEVVGDCSMNIQSEIAAIKNDSNEESAKKPETKKISVTLKTKKFKKKKRAPPKVIAATTPEATPIIEAPPLAKALIKSHVQRQQVATMEKWDAVKTNKNEEPATITACQAGPVIETKKGEPICTTCMRRFPNLDQIRLHERVSQLHKENLRKEELKRKREEERKRNDERKQQRQEGPARKREPLILFPLPPPRPAWLRPTWEVIRSHMEDKNPKSDQL
jgi:hypothetical protein